MSLQFTSFNVRRRPYLCSATALSTRSRWTFPRWRHDGASSSLRVLSRDQEPLRRRSSVIQPKDRLCTGYPHAETVVPVPQAREEAVRLFRLVLDVLELELELSSVGGGMAQQKSRPREPRLRCSVTDPHRLTSSIRPSTTGSRASRARMSLT